MSYPGGQGDKGTKGQSPTLRIMTPPMLPGREERTIALTHPSCHPGKVVAPTEMLPKVLEAALRVEASASW